METNFVILAAGRGVRLGGDVPKPLTVLADGRTILQQQLDNLVEAFGESVLGRTTVVVGYRAEVIRSALPESVNTVLNADYETTNTARSLVLGLAKVPAKSAAVWLNGDVVFDSSILQRAKGLLASKSSFAVVEQGPTGEEEVKYALDGQGFISAISKTVNPAMGEAVGINHVAASELAHFADALLRVRPQDYFEAAMELSIRNRRPWLPLPVGDAYAVEVDFPEDLQRANRAQSRA